MLKRYTFALHTDKDACLINALEDAQNKTDLIKRALTLYVGDNVTNRDLLEAIESLRGKVVNVSEVGEVEEDEELVNALDALGV
jgi:hypothetical protein